GRALATSGPGPAANAPEGSSALAAGRVAAAVSALRRVIGVMIELPSKLVFEGEPDLGPGWRRRGSAHGHTAVVAFEVGVLERRGEPRIDRGVDLGVPLVAKVGAGP